MQIGSLIIASVIGLGFVVTPIVYAILLIPLKWIVLGRCVPGRYNIDSSYGLRYALVQSWCTAPLVRLFTTLFSNTCFANILLRCFGAKLGKRVLISCLSPSMLAAADQLRIGNRVVLEEDCALLGAVVEKNVLVIGAVSVDSDAFIADRAMVMPGSLIGKGALVSVRSFIPKLSKLGEGSVWHGSPAVCLDPGLMGRERLETRWHFSMRQVVLNRKARQEDVDSQMDLRSGLASALLWLKPSLRQQSSRNMSKPEDAFSLGSLLAKDAATGKGAYFGSNVLPLFVPFVFVPAWLILVFIGPLELFGYVSYTNQKDRYTLFPVFLILGGFVIYPLFLLYNLIYSMNEVLNGGVIVELWHTILTASLNLSSMFFFNYFMGTRWITYFFRATGVRVGRDVYLESIPAKDFGLVAMEDNVTVARDATVVSYVVRDMKGMYKATTLKTGTTFGPCSYISSGSTIESHGAIGPLSTAADGETVDEGCYAEGAPLLHVGEWFNPESSRPGPSEEALQLFNELRQDAQLAESIQPPRLETHVGTAAPRLCRDGPPQVVLLTGATGFVGGFILRELLKPERGVKKVICLVRASSAEDGANRIKKQLIYHELCTAEEWETLFVPIISVLPGDLGKPGLGLHATTLAQLADDVDVIINNGALVNVSKDYSTMRSANVDAVRTMLEIAAGGSAPSALHQISTVGTLPRGTGRLVTEDFSSTDPSYLGSGYDQSKWVSEQLISEASKRGLPVALHRLGRIGGDSHSGGANESDFFMLIIKGKESGRIHLIYFIG